MEEIQVMKAENQNEFLDFEKQKVQVLTLDQLKRTQDEKDIQGNPLMGMFHHQLIDEVTGLCQEHGYKTEIYDLFAAQNRERRSPGVTIVKSIAEEKGERAIEAHVLRRVYANIRIKDFDTDVYTTNLAISYHQRGIQVGFGPNVKICHNQCMLGAERYVATYSGKGMGDRFKLDEVMETVKGWLVDAKTLIDKDMKVIETMKRRKIAADEMFTLIGMLTAYRVACDSTNQQIRLNKTYPLSQTQICRVTEDMLVRYKQNQEVTAWDLYDSATHLYKPTSTDIPQILPQNVAMYEFLQENVL